MLIPIGPENDTVRRVPWVTIAIMGLCFLIHIVNTGAISEHEEKLGNALDDVIDYYMSRPYLELDKEIKESIFYSEEMEELSTTMSMNKYSSGPGKERLEEEQAHLDNLVKKLELTKKRHPFYKFGFVPNDKTFFGLIGHMFLHGGWEHLLLNLFYLYLLGPFLEDVWGKPTYAAFYLGSGILASLAFCTHYPNSGVPLIGASGAIFGLMGGYAIRYWHVRIKYFYWFLFGFRIRFGTFSAPAWVILPLGVIIELLVANLMDSIAPEGGGGVAHWAHVWGFIFGAAGALLIKHLKIEEKFVAPKIEAETTYVNKSFVAYEEAMQVLAQGDKEKAYAMLIDAAKEDTSNQDIMEALWNIALETGRTGEVAPLLTRLIEREIQQGRLEPALVHYKQLRPKFPDTRFATHTKIKIFEQSIIARDPDEAKSLFKELINEVNLASPPGLVTELCTAAFKFDLNFDQSLAGKVVELALQHPEIPDDRKESLKQQLYAIPKQKADAPIKVKSHYDSDFSQPDSKADMGGVSSSSSFVVPPVPMVSAVPPVPQKPVIPDTPYQSQPPPIPQEPTIPANPQEPEIPLITGETTTPITPYQSQPPPIFEEPTIPVNPQEPINARESIPSQPPPIPIEPVIPIDPREPEIPSIIQEPTIPPSPQEPTIPTTPSQAQPPPPPIEPIIPVMSRESAVPDQPGEPMAPVQPEPLAEDNFSPPPPPAPRKNLRVTKAVPLGVTGGKISLKTEKMGQKVFALEKIKVVAVVKISPPEERPFLLIDLLVDDPGEPAVPTAREDVIRTLRLVSTDFNPQKFVAGGQGPLEAFKIFTSALLRLSKAKPFPNIESVQLKKAANYRSINEYEEALLKTGSK